jgi:lipoprotein-releasing system permease protein
VRFETFVASRYLRGKRKNRFVSLITIISMAGVCVGVVALIVVLSVMTGFDIALRDTIIGNRAHVTVTMRGGGTMLDPNRAITAVEAINPEVIAAGPIIQVEALLKRSEYATGAFIVGVDPERETEVTMLAENLTKAAGRTHGMGELPEYKEIVLGFRLAQRLGLTVGSEVGVVTAKEALTPFGRRQGSQLFLTVSGISQAKMSDFDNLYCFVNLETARMLTGRDGVDGINLKLNNAFAAQRVADRIMQSDMPYVAETWYQSQIEFFQALQQEKLAMFVILTFIVLVAAFNITSTLIMVVMEKRRDIGILRTLGASSGSILVLFIVEGLLIGLSGTFFGVVFGVLLAYYINPIAVFIGGLFGIDVFNTTIYYFDRIPVAIIPQDVAVITVSAIVLTFLSTLYPAWSAARLNPVDALRNE